MRRSDRKWRTSFTALLVWALASVAVAAGEAAAQSVYTVAELSEAPRLVSTERTVDLIKRAYPRELQAQGIGGRVQLEIIIDTQGKVEASSVRVVAAEVEELGKAALTIAPQLEFHPGKKDGTAVRSRVILPVVFNTR